MSRSDRANFGRTESARNHLPPWFERPISSDDRQHTLFQRPLPGVLAELHVSADELQRWHAVEWVSFGPDRPEPLEHRHVNEIRFVRDVVRFGLPDAITAVHFEQLPRPMNFNPHAVAYSFSLGWVMARTEPEPDPSDVVDEHIDEWLAELAEAGDRERLEETQTHIEDLLSSMPETESDDRT